MTKQELSWRSEKFDKRITDFIILENKNVLLEWRSILLL